LFISLNVLSKFSRNKNAHNKEETQKGKMRQKKRGHAHALILSNYCIFI